MENKTSERMLTQEELLAQVDQEVLAMIDGNDSGSSLIFYQCNQCGRYGPEELMIFPPWKEEYICQGCQDLVQEEPRTPAQLEAEDRLLAEAYPELWSEPAHHQPWPQILAQAVQVASGATKTMTRAHNAIERAETLLGKIESLLSRVDQTHECDVCGDSGVGYRSADVPIPGPPGEDEMETIYFCPRCLSQGPDEWVCLSCERVESHPPDYLIHPKDWRMVGELWACPDCYLEAEGLALVARSG